MKVVVGGPFELNQEDEFSYWGCPSWGRLSGSLLDLSSIHRQSEKTDPVKRGNGLFPVEVNDLSVIPNEYHIFSSETTKPSLINFNQLDIEAYNSLFEVSLSNTTRNLTEANCQCLTELSDPTGIETGSLMPCKSRVGRVRYNLSIKFGGHTYTESFNRENPHVTMWLDRFHRDVLKVQSEHGDIKAGQFIGFAAIEIKEATGSVNIDLLIPQGSGLRALPPDTTITDDFSVDSTGDYYNNVGSQTFSVTGGEAQFATNEGRTGLAHNTALSSSDHYCQMTTVSNVGSAQSIGETVRCAGAGVETFYLGANQYNTDTQRQLFKLVTGTATQLDSVAKSLTGTYKLDISGSTLEELEAEVAHLSATDSSITGNLNAGMRTFSTSASVTSNVDDLEISDGLGGGGGGTGTGTVPGASSGINYRKPSCRVGVGF